MSRDNIFAMRHDKVGQFRFDDEVAQVFPDMISRSVPGYASILSVIEQLAARYVTAGSNVYDLGCSLGAATFLMRQQAPRDAVIHAVDNSAAMMTRLQQRLSEEPAEQRCPVQLHQCDIRDLPMQNASLIVLNFTLQFIPEQDRSQLLKACYQAMQPGAALVLSEKVCYQDPAQQHHLTELHLDFKRACGYSEMEISQKRTSLENTLIPESIETHCGRLRNVGFASAFPWFQCFNFVSMLALKPDE